tara:strand:- start:23 stop:274 length:252 start_codon:yes stop_codon:yes gene_type:complete
MQTLVLVVEQAVLEQQQVLLELLQLTLAVEVELLVPVQEEQVVEEQEILFRHQHQQKMEQTTLAAVELDKVIQQLQELEDQEW